MLCDINYNESLYLDPYKHYIYELYLNLTRIEGGTTHPTFKKILEIQNSIIVIYKNAIPDLYSNNPQLESQIELYQYSEDLLIENIIGSIIIITNDISIYNTINMLGGIEIYNIKTMYQLY